MSAVARQSSASENATQSLAQFATGADLTNIPAEVLHEAKRTLINYLGCVMGGNQHQTIEKLIAATRPFWGKDQCTLIGRDEKADAVHAALINGTANNVYGYDDTHLPTITHPGGPVLSAILALSALYRVSGQDLLEAVIIGVDITCRTARALGSAHVDQGWHVSSTCGAFGAAAAVGRLIGLNPEQMSHAFGIVGSQPNGLRLNFGTMTVSLHIGLAARAGLEAALLAKQGFRAHEAILDEVTLWAGALTPQFQRKMLTNSIGQTFEITENSYKPYACGIVTHPIIDGCRDLAATHDLKVADIRAIGLRVHPFVKELTGRLPDSALRSKVSVQHAAAVGLAHRAGGIDQFNHAAFVDETIARLRGLVTLECDESLARDEAFVTLELVQGTTVTQHVKHARGSRARPLTDQDLLDKLLGLTKDILPTEQATTLFKVAMSVEKLTNVEDLLHLTRSSRKPSALFVN